MSIKISRILHAGYLFESDGTQIVFDPIFENPFSHNCYAFPCVEFDAEQIRSLRPQAVFISHYHDDHCSLDSLDFLDRNTPIYIYCLFEELLAMIRELGFANVNALAIDVPVQVGPFEVIPRQALDAEVDSLFQIKASGLNVLNVVDSWIDPTTLSELVQNGPWDMVLWPFQTMREVEVLAPSRALHATGKLPYEWSEQLKSLNPRYVVPSSCQFNFEIWSWYNRAFFPVTYRTFQLEVKAVLPNTEIVRLDPSVTVILDANSLVCAEPLPWVRIVSGPVVDYLYDGDLKAPPTAEIATRFPALTTDEAEQVLNYCRSGLLQRYREIALSIETYFHKPRHWCLSIYSHTGEVTRFHYHLNATGIELTEGANEPLAWLTEVPSFKLYSALMNGETLSSIYIRINDVVFTPEIEAEIQEVDVVEDPLIRCLYNGVFGGYQTAQLKRLKQRSKLVEKRPMRS